MNAVKVHQEQFQHGQLYIGSDPGWNKNVPFTRYPIISYTEPLLQRNVITCISQIDAGSIYTLKGIDLKKIIRDSYLGKFDGTSLEFNSATNNNNGTLEVSAEAQMDKKDLDKAKEVKNIKSEPILLPDVSDWVIQHGGELLTPRNGLLTSFMLAAMKQVTEEKLDDGSIYCEIPSCPGVWANEDTLQECIIELRQALELWLFLKIKDNDPLPVLNGIDLNTIGSEFIETDE